MIVFVLWHHAGHPHESPDPARVAARLQSIYAPLFASLPAARVHQWAGTTLVYLELPVRHWKPATFQQDSDGWALAPDYPLNARSAMASNGIRYTEGNILLRLCRNLQQGGEALLRDLAPPLSLIWTDSRAQETIIQNDGLGHAQLFEYHTEPLWVLSNRIFALKALGINLEPDPEQWAIRFALDWFPLEMTGYRRVRYLGPATRLHVGPHGVRRSQTEVLRHWVSGSNLSREDCLELARCSLDGMIEEVAPLWEKAHAGLSGGWDSRAVVATLRALGINFLARVRGLPDRPDVIVAQRLAKLAGMDLRVGSSGGLPPDSAPACRHSIERALLWQGGFAATRKHVTFLARKEHLGAGGVNIMGSAGEVCRGYYSGKFASSRRASSKEIDGRAVEMVLRIPPFTRGKYRDAIRAVALDALKSADRYGLEGLRRLDFFYLFERVRRWRSGTMNAQTALILAPFLNPRLITATFSYPCHELSSYPFHRHIVARHAPDWVGVPHAEELSVDAPDDVKSRPATAVAKEAEIPAWRRPVGNKTHDRALYWEIVGQDLIKAAFSEGGFWTELFDPDLAVSHWQVAPDALAIAHVLPGMIEKA